VANDPHATPAPKNATAENAAVTRATTGASVIPIRLQECREALLFERGRARIRQARHGSESVVDQSQGSNRSDNAREIIAIFEVFHERRDSASDFVRCWSVLHLSKWKPTVSQSGRRPGRLRNDRSPLQAGTTRCTRIRAVKRMIPRP
jgi:hypothetical protein